MKKLLLLPLLFLVACAEDSKGPNPPISNIQYLSNHTDFNPFIEEFLSLAQFYGVHLKNRYLTVSFSETLGIQINGSCGVSNSVANITINKQLWDLRKSSKAYHWMEYLMFHELAHCLLGRDHIDDAGRSPEYVGAIPSGSFYSSIMHRYMMGNLNVYSKNRGSYLRELFLRETPSLFNLNGEGFDFSSLYEGDLLINNHSHSVYSKTNMVEVEETGCVYQL